MRGEVLYEPSPDERYLARLGTLSYIYYGIAAVAIGRLSAR